MKKLLMYTALSVLWVPLGNAITFQNDLDEDAYFTVRIRWTDSTEFQRVDEKIYNLDKLTARSSVPGGKVSMSLWKILEHGKKSWVSGMEEMQIVALPLCRRCSDQILTIDISEDITNEQFKQRIEVLDEKTATLSSPDKTWLNAIFTVD